MTEGEIKKAVKEAVAEALKNQAQPVVCFIGLDRDTHTKEHQFLKSLMAIDEKIDKIKWSLLRDTLKDLRRIFIVCIIIGALWWIKMELK